MGAEIMGFLFLVRRQEKEQRSISYTISL